MYALSGGRVHSGSGGFTPPHLALVVFNQVSVGLLRRAYGSTGLFGLAWVHSCTPRFRRVHSGSRGVTLAHLENVWIIRVRVGSLGRS